MSINRVGNTDPNLDIYKTKDNKEEISEDILNNNIFDCGTKIEESSTIEELEDFQSYLKKEQKNAQNQDFSTKDSNSIESETLKLIEVELDKKISEIKTESESKTGFGAAWNGIKGVFNKGTKGELDKTLELKEKIENLKSDSNIEEIKELYLEVFGVEFNESEIEKSINTKKELEKGELKLSNGTIVSMKDISQELLAQSELLETSFEKSVEQQGIFTKIIGKANNFLGIGTTENMTSAQIENYKNLVQKLVKTDDIEEFSALYKAISGEELTSESLDELFEGNSKVENSKAAESIMDYEETNENIKNTAIAIGTGIAVTAMGPVGAVLAGSAIAVGVNGIDAATQNNNQGVINNLVDYCQTDLLKDGLVGGINGLTGKLGNMAGEKLAGTFLNKNINQTASRLAGEFIDGAVDAALSSSGEYLVDSAAGEEGNFKNEKGQFAAFDNFKENFDLEEMISQTTTSALMGGVMSVGMQEGLRGVSKGFNNLETKYVNSYFEDITPIIDPQTGKQVLTPEMFFVDVDGYGKNFEWGYEMSNAVNKTSELIQNKENYETVMDNFIINTKDIQEQFGNNMIGGYGVIRDSNIVQGYNYDSNQLQTSFYSGKYSYFKDKLIKSSNTLDKKCFQYNKTSKEFPLAKTTKVMYYNKGNDQFAFLLHPSGADNITYAQDVYQKLINTDNPSEKFIIDSVAKMHWLLATNAPFQRGSDSISSGLSKAIFQAYDIQISPLKKGISIDFEAFSTNMEDFVKNYSTFFKAKPVKIK